MRVHIWFCLHLGCSSSKPALSSIFFDDLVQDLGGNDWLEMVGDSAPSTPRITDPIFDGEEMGRILTKHPVEAYKIRFQQLEYSEVFSACTGPPREIFLEHFDGPYEVNAERFAKGSMTSIYKAYFYGPDGGHTVLNRSVVKFVTLRADAGVVDSLHRDMAALEVLSGSGIAPEPMKIVYSDSKCDSRMMVSAFAGERTLKNLKRNDKFSSNLSMMAQIAIRGLEILQVLHSKGIVHGDIHVENFVFFNDSPIARTMKLIDFGRSVPYLVLSEDKFVHVADEAAPATFSPYYWTLSLLSVYELESVAKQRSHTMSRRDDVSRFAEMFLVIMLDDQYEDRFVGKDLEAIFAIKKEPKEFLNSTFREFYEYSCKMNFDETPQYEVWISKFEKLVGAGFDTPFLD